MALATKIIEKQEGYTGDVFDPAASVFVSANAGSGKTSQLTRRVLGLLLSGVAPGKILCLTFTNAAAAEMKQRVQAELGAWVMAEEKTLYDTLQKLLGYVPDTSMLARARSLFAQVLEAPEGVRIQTIHGFCQSLLARFPIEANISPHFAVMDSRTADEMLANARLDLLVSHTHEPQVEEAIRTLARILNTEDFQSLLSDIVKNKFKFESLIRLPGGVDAAIETLHEQLGVTPNTTLASLIETHFAYDAATENKLRYIADTLLKTSDAELGQTLSDWLFAVDSRAEILSRYLICFLTQKNTKRKRLCADGNLSDEDIIHLLAEQERVMRFHDARQSWQIAMQTSCVLRLAETLLGGYENLKRAHAKMDYDDLILTARDLLQRPGISPWVLYKLDGGIDHVLVDEAQDTSPEQWEIVKALTDDFFSGISRSEADRALFIVGDEKQSIFSFQGADVRQLANAHTWFNGRITQAGKKLETQTLERSYRSLPNILQAVDAVFSTAEVRAGVVTNDTTLQHIAHREGEGLVELWPVIVPAADEIEGTGMGYISPYSQLARKLAETIHRWIHEGRWNACDIMILVRTRTTFVDQMVRALKRKGVPVAGVDRMLLGKNLAVMDLMALGKILLLPEDDLTLAALLKSPMLNVSEEKLFSLCWNRGKKTLWQRVREELPEAHTLLADLHAKTDYLLPYELYAYALDTLGLRKKILGRMGAEYADPIEEFLSQALAYQQENVPSLQGFLHWLEASESEIKRDMEQAHDAVRIMTVHGAKGLQAPVVILADTVKMPILRDKPLWSGDLPLWVKAAEDDNALSGELRATAKESMLEEYRRLLYVAMTRAEDALYICGASSKKPGEYCWHTLVQQTLTPFGSTCDTPVGEGIRLGSEHPKRSEAKSKGLKALRQARDESKFSFLTALPPDESLSPKPLTPSHTGEEPSAVTPLNTNIYARGLFIHSLLQHLPSLPEEKRLAVAKSLALPYQTQMPDVEIKNGIAEAMTVMVQFPKIFSDESLAEVPVAGTIKVKGEPFVVSGQIDRLAIMEKEVWIVDYKTNRLPPDNAAQAPTAYLRQMAVYRALLAKIYPSRRIRCALLWTASPRMDVLDEAVLDSYIQRSTNEVVT